MASERIVPLSEYHRLPQAALSADFYKRRLEVVCNNATLALFIMDEYQRCVYMNPAAETLTGYSLAETQGRALHDVIHHTRPDTARKQAEADRQQALQAGFQRHLSKPIEPEGLIQAIVALIQRTGGRHGAT